MSSIMPRYSLPRDFPFVNSLSKRTKTLLVLTPVFLAMIYQHIVAPAITCDTLHSLEGRHHRDLDLDIFQCDDTKTPYQSCMIPGSYPSQQIAETMIQAFPATLSMRRSAFSWKFWRLFTQSSYSGLDQDSLTSLHLAGLDRWSQCKKPTETTIATGTDYDYPCFFEAFDLLFFGNSLRAHVSLRPFTPTTTTRTFSYQKPGHYHHRPKTQEIAWFNSTTVLPAHTPTGSPIILASLTQLLHNMVHAVLDIYSCPICTHTSSTATSCFQTTVTSIGVTGHGPSFQTMLLALEMVASSGLYGGPLGKAVGPVEWNLHVTQSWREEVSAVVKMYVRRGLKDWPFEDLRALRDWAGRTWNY